MVVSCSVVRRLRVARLARAGDNLSRAPRRDGAYGVAAFSCSTLPLTLSSGGRHASRILAHLYVERLRDMRDAEDQILEALPKLIERVQPLNCELRWSAT